MKSYKTVFTKGDQLFLGNDLSKFLQEHCPELVELRESTFEQYEPSTLELKESIEVTSYLRVIK